MSRCRKYLKGFSALQVEVIAQSYMSQFLIFQVCIIKEHPMAREIKAQTMAITMQVLTMAMITKAVIMGTTMAAQ